MRINRERFHVVSKEYTARGVFFRLPWLKVDADDYYDEEIWFLSMYSAIMVLCEKSVRGFFLRLLNHKKVKHGGLYGLWKHVYHVDSSAGFTIKIWCSPVYFSRVMRELHVVAISPTEKLLELHSVGYEVQYNNCAGACAKEWTRVKLNTYKGKKWKRFYSHVRRGYGNEYNLTYEHRVQEEYI